MKKLLQRLDASDQITKITSEVSTDLDISAIMRSFANRPLLFERVKGASFRVAGNLYCTSQILSLALGLRPGEDVTKFIENASKDPASSVGHVEKFDPSSWDYNGEVDLSKLPILKHYDNEAGHYITAGIIVAKGSGTSENLSFHRMLVLSKNELTARIVSRHLDRIARDSKEKKIPITILIGPPPEVFVSASLQVQYGMSEYKIANKMSEGALGLSTSERSDILFPADTEIVLEGLLDYGRTTKEGPFVDLTQTYDDVREQPIIRVERIHYRKDSVYQAVLAGSSEHALFMGLPQEIKIREALAKSIPKVRGVNLTSASEGYFHCIVSIEKTNDGDGKTTILNCLAASHPLKIVTVVDSDIDPFNLSDVEWALATRFQANKGLVVIDGARGSSLDPSSGKSAITSKLGLDATLPIQADRSKFNKANISTSETARAIIDSLGSKQ
ncbi:MAG: UbiD family decarboxylase [Nitrososphaerales archaeon]